MDSGTEHNDDCGRDQVARYEELRAQALEASGRAGRAWGWALFVRKGMAAWLGAWQEHLPQSVPEFSVSYDSLPETGHEQQREIVMVWTGMVMGQLPRSIVCTP